MENLKFKKTYYLLTVFFVTILIEFVSFIMVKTDLLTVGETPKLYSNLITTYNSPTTHWYIEKDPWGVWHKKNSDAKLKRDCLNFNFKSNEIGARDSSFLFSADEKKQVVLLGDSFAEPFGVNIEDSAQSVIEKITGYNVLNFGTSGGFGPLNYYLIYRELASEYPHNSLLVFFLPANDFTDNDYAYNVNGKSTYINGINGKERYRPYYTRAENNTFKFFYPLNSIKRDNWLNTNELSEKYSFIKFYKNNFWSSNLLREAVYLMKVKNSKNFPINFNQYSGYFDPTLEQQESAVYFIKEIIKLAGGKNIYLISIPTQNDFKEIKVSGNYRKLEEMYWWSKFNEFTKTFRNFKFIDLINFQQNDFNTLFLPCDGHWSVEGNTWAGKIISSILNKE